MCNHRKLLTGMILRIKTELYFIKYRASNLHPRIPRTRRMNAGSRQHIPCWHLTNIFIAHNSFHFIIICILTNISRPLLCMPRHTELVEKERHEMHRFIGMIIVAIPQQIWRSLIKHIRQIGYYLFFSSHQFHHSRHIMRHKPSLLISIGLNTTIPFFRQRIFGPSHPWSICIARTKPAFFFIKNMMICLSLFIKVHCIFFFSHCLCQLWHAPICIRIFQCIRDTQSFGSITQWIISKFTWCIDRILISLLCIVSANTFHISICQYWQCWVAQHTTWIGV